MTFDFFEFPPWLQVALFIAALLSVTYLGVTGDE